jgi:hypothetical protein
MLVRTDFQQLDPQQRSRLILTEARSELNNRLWRSALGSTDERAPAAMESGSGGTSGFGLDALLNMLAQQAAGVSPSPAPGEPQAGNVGASDAPSEAVAPATSVEVTGLGPNAKHEPALAAAAARTGLPASALAAIVNAEAAKTSDGSWNSFSRNPRSSAAGLGQFLSGTWQGMAETKGTWLNQIADKKGWLGDNGRVLPAARAELLSLRYDATASINTVADYARQNLDGLKRSGVPVGTDADSVAKGAYLGHHLGLRDAVRFMSGGLDPARARLLLNAQVGASSAGERIAAAGNASSAHRAWLLAYVDRNLRPERFA